MFKDNTQFRERFNRWKLGELVYDKGRPIDPPEVELPTVVVTPDYEYNLYLGTLPANQRLADESEYRQHRYWELNGKPKNFKEAVSKGMFEFNRTDNSWHAGSVAWNDSIKGYEFMKPKTHPTTYMEIDAYNSDEMSDFRKQFELEDNPNLEYYRYLPRYPLYRKGKDDDPPIDVGFLPTVNVTAPRTRWSKGYGDDGNPIYTSNYKESDEYLNNFLSKGKAEKKRERWYAQNVGSNGQQRPGLHGYAADIALAAEIGIGGALAPLFFAPIVAGAAPAAQALVTPASAFWTNPLTRQIVAGTTASTAVDAGSKAITGNTWGENIAGGIKDVTGWDPRNSIYTSWIPDATNPGWFMNPTRVLNTVNSTVQGTKKGILFLNSPLTGKWTQFGNNEYRFNPNNLGAFGSGLEIRPSQQLSQAMKDKGWTIENGVFIHPKGGRFVRNSKGRLISEESFKNEAIARKNAEISAARKEAIAAAEKKEKIRLSKIYDEFDNLGLPEFREELWFLGRPEAGDGSVTKEDLNVWRSHFPEYMKLAKLFLNDGSLYKSGKRWFGKFSDGNKPVIPEEYIVAHSKAFTDAGLVYDGVNRMSAMTKKTYRKFLKNGGLGATNWATDSGPQVQIFGEERDYGPIVKTLVSKDAPIQLVPNDYAREGRELLHGIQHSKNVDYRNGGTGNWTLFGHDMQMKSLRGNNGDFDMKNKHIYRSLLPLFLGGGSATTLYNSLNRNDQ